MKKLFILAAMVMSMGLAQTVSAQRGIVVYGKTSDTPIASAAFTQLKSLSFRMPSVVMLAQDDTELQTINIKDIDRIVISESVPTAIRNVETAEQKRSDNRMYNLLGQEIKTARGVVIKNGKKYVKK